jgi:hypothetical protein
VGIESLIKLSDLGIRNCPLKNLAGVGQLINLKNLYCGDNILRHLIHAIKLTTCDIHYTHFNYIVSLDKLNLIKFIEKNQFNNYNYWQNCRKFPRHFKFVIFDILKKMFIVDFKYVLMKNENLYKHYLK